jgi:hypothetical protein
MKAVLGLGGGSGEIERPRFGVGIRAEISRGRGGWCGQWEGKLKRGLDAGIWRLQKGRAPVEAGIDGEEWHAINAGRMRLRQD